MAALLTGPAARLLPVAAPRANLAALHGVRRLGPARVYPTLATGSRRGAQALALPG